MSYLCPESKEVFEQEEVKGTLRDDECLSLEDEDNVLRLAIMERGWQNWQNALDNFSAVNSDAQSDWNDVSRPRVGDWVMETSSYFRKPYMAFGILLRDRYEYNETEEEYLANCESEDDKRYKDRTYYIQYGPCVDDVCRWQNASFIKIPEHLVTAP